ncbi:MAG TPA: response regulator transcription factor [Ramlibacter sp.]|nr:response regulator transcription factor [Ramlibacter sp.]
MPCAAFIVEDHAAIREGLSEALQELAGISTSGWAGSVQEALAWLAAPLRAWDIAIVDLLLPDGSGLQVLRALQGRAPARKVVVLTATATAPVRARCLALGADAVFDKAMETEPLLDWCAAVAAASASVGPGAAPA